MRRAAALGLLALTAAGCGGGDAEATLSTSDVVRALRSAGYKGLQVRSEVATLPAHRPDVSAGRSGLVDVDRISVGRLARSTLLPLTAVRLQTVDAAKDAYAGDAPLREGAVPPGLPPSFDASKFHEARVCNVLIASYGDGPVSARYEAAVDALEQACR